jgi:hypothetical protein
MKIGLFSQLIKRVTTRTIKLHFSWLHRYYDPKIGVILPTKKQQLEGHLPERDLAPPYSRVLAIAARLAQGAQGQHQKGPWHLTRHPFTALRRRPWRGELMSRRDREYVCGLTQEFPKKNVIQWPIIMANIWHTPSFCVLYIYTYINMYIYNIWFICVYIHICIYI